MFRILMLFLTFALTCTTPSTWAHGSDQHVLGTVTLIDASHVEVKSPKGKTIDVQINKQTRFREKGNPKGKNLPQVGDRVVIEATKDNGSLIATEVHFSSAGIEASTFSAGLAAVFVLTLLNLLVRPILFVLTLPLIVLSLGLFLIVVNALLLEFTAYLVKGFSVDGFWPAVGGAIIISLVTTILNAWTIDHQRTAPLSSPQRQPKIINPEEGRDL